jgi:Flp pilus assembly protein TadG
MNGTLLRKHPSHKRRGTTVVETALVLPVFLLFVFVLIEIGHAQMVKNMLRGACRDGARMGCTEGSTTADVQAHVKEVLASIIDPSRVTVNVKDASVYDQGGTPPQSSSALAALPNLEVNGAEQGQLFVVQATVNYNDVAIIPMSVPIVGNIMSNLTLDGHAFIRHE